MMNDPATRLARRATHVLVDVLASTSSGTLPPRTTLSLNAPRRQTLWIDAKCLLNLRGGTNERYRTHPHNRAPPSGRKLTPKAAIPPGGMGWMSRLGLCYTLFAGLSCLRGVVAKVGVPLRGGDLPVS